LEKRRKRVESEKGSGGRTFGKKQVNKQTEERTINKVGKKFLSKNQVWSWETPFLQG